MPKCADRDRVDSTRATRTADRPPPLSRFTHQGFLSGRSWSACHRNESDGQNLWGFTMESLARVCGAGFALCCFAGHRAAAATLGIWFDGEPAAAPPIINSYGGRSLHEQSHGESFFALVTERFGGRGLYILDEPEATIAIAPDGTDIPHP